MKTITLLTLLITVGCILATGCVAQPKQDSGNATVSPTSTFSPLVTTTTVPGTPMTTLTDVPKGTSKLKGPLRVSIGGYDAYEPLTVLIGGQTVGVVSQGVPLDLMVDEGNHSVTVCVGVICPEKFVDIAFAKSSYLDFEDILKMKAEFSKPTVRILNSYRNGNGVNVELEFINPTKKDLFMSAVVSCGYSYIDDRSDLRMGNSVQYKVSDWVVPGGRITRMANLYFSGGDNINYDEPALGEVTVK